MASHDLTGAPVAVPGVNAGTRYKVTAYTRNGGIVYVQAAASAPTSIEDAERLSPWPHLLSSVIVEPESGESLYVWAKGSGPGFGTVRVVKSV